MGSTIVFPPPSGGEVTLAKDDVGLSNVDNTSDLDKPISIATQNALNAVQTSLEDRYRKNEIGNFAEFNATLDAALIVG